MTGQGGHPDDHGLEDVEVQTLALVWAFGADEGLPLHELEGSDGREEELGEWAQHLHRIEGSLPSSVQRLHHAGLVEVRNRHLCLTEAGRKVQLATEVRQQGIRAGAALLRAQLSNQPWLPSSWAAFSSHRHALAALFEYAVAVFGTEDPDYCDDVLELMLRVAVHLHSRDLLEDALSMTEALWQLLDQLLHGEVSERRARLLVRALAQHGRIESARGRYREARDMLRYALLRMERDRLDEPLERARLLIYKARAEKDLGQHGEALDDLAEADELLLAEHLSAARARHLFTMGRLWIELGKGDRGRKAIDAATPSAFVPLLEFEMPGDEGRARLTESELPRRFIAHGVACRSRGDHGAALWYFREALHLNEVHFGAEHLTVARTLDHLAVVLRDHGAYGEAILAYEEAIRIKRVRLGDDRHPDIGRTLVRLAGVQRRDGRLAVARATVDEGLAIVVERLGADHPEAAVAKSTRAAVLRSQGEYLPALKEIDAALGILDPFPMHRERCFIYANKAAALRANGELDHARAAAVAAVEAADECLGPESRLPELARAQLEMARVCRRRREEDGAQLALTAALGAIDEAFDGVPHPDTAKVLANWGRLHRDLDEAAAEEKLLDALGVALVCLGDDHPDVVKIRNDLARVHIDQGRAAEAVPVLERSLALQRECYGRQHSEIAITLGSLGDAHARLGDAARMIERKNEALAMKRVLFPLPKRGLDHPEAARTGMDFGMAHLDCLDAGGEGSIGAALRLLRRAVRSYLDAYKADHPDTARAQVYLGDALLRDGRPRREIRAAVGGGAAFIHEAKDRNPDLRERAERLLAVINEADEG